MTATAHRPRRVPPEPPPSMEQLRHLVEMTDDGDFLADLLLEAAQALYDITEDDLSRPVVNSPNKVARRALARVRNKLENPPVTRENTTDGPSS